MPILKNSRHEMFAHAVAKGSVPGNAYVSAGYSTNGADRNAHRLMKKDEIKSRIDEIKANIAKMGQEKAGIDKAWILTMLQDIAKYHWKRNAAASNRALELMGKEAGMFRERVGLEGVDGGPAIFVIQGIERAKWLPKPGDGSKSGNRESEK